MVLPKYVETEWYGEGRAVLLFKKSDEKTSDSDDNNTSISQKESSSKSKNDASSSDKSPTSNGDNGSSSPAFGKITCYVSSLRIREYEEIPRKSKLDDDANVAEDYASEQTESQPLKTDLLICPPDVSPEIWQSWLMHWEAWNEIYIPLAWVQKHRSHCTQSYIDWHDNYIQEYPGVIPFIREGLNEETRGTPVKPPQEESNSQEQGGDDHPQENIDEDHDSNETHSKDENERSKWDKLYEEFSDRRYWIHLRSFLQNNGVERTDRLVQFFTDHAHVDYCGSPVQEKTSSLECMATEGDDSSLKNLDSDEIEKDTEQSVTELNLSNSEVERKDISDEKSVSITEGSEDHSNAEEGDKVGMKRRQKDGVSEDNQPEESEIDTSAAQRKRSKPNPLFEKNIIHDDEESMTSPDSPDLRKHKNQSPQRSPLDSTNADFGFDSEDKENFDGVKTPNNKSNRHKTSKLKKKKHLSSTSVRNAGLGWVMSVVDKSWNKVSEEKEEDDEEGEATCETSSSGVDNIFSVQAHTPDVIGSQGDGMLSSLGNLPSADYQFRADELHLREDSRKLSECFDSQDNSPVEEQKKTLAGDSDSVPNTDLSCADSKSEKDHLTNDDDSHIKKSNRSRDENVVKAEIIADSDDEKGASRVEDNLNVMSKKEVSCKAVAVHNSWSLANYLRVLGKAMMMFASHLLGIIFPSFSVHSGSSILGMRGNRTFLGRWFGMLRPQKPPPPSVKMLKKATCQVKLEKWLQQESSTEMHPAGSECFSKFYSHEELRETKTIYQSLGTFTQGDGLAHIVVDTLDLNHYSEQEEPQDDGEEDWQRMQITFDEEGNPVETSTTSGRYEGEHESDRYEREKMLWKNIIAHHRLISYNKNKEETPPPVDLPKHLHKYWAQRHRLFLRYDEGIRLDEESWYSVTPEMIAAHHAYRCSCKVVVDGFCGSGGNAIQLASTCSQVIAIDVDPAKIKLAQHNARVYGVEDRIRFIVGDFFQVAPTLKADVVLLSPPWGGTEYLQEEVYDVKSLGGAMDCKKLMDTARSITKNIVLYLPRSSDLLQVIELAGLGGCVDLEYNYMGKKKKALTAYFGDLVHY